MLQLVHLKLVRNLRLKHLSSYAQLGQQIGVWKQKHSIHPKKAVCCIYQSVVAVVSAAALMKSNKC